MNSCSGFWKEIHNGCTIIPVPGSIRACASSDIWSKVGTSFLCPFKSGCQGMIKVGKSLWKSPSSPCSAQGQGMSACSGLFPLQFGASSSQETQQLPGNFCWCLKPFQAFHSVITAEVTPYFLFGTRAHKGLCGAVISVPPDTGPSQGLSSQLGLLCFVFQNLHREL